MSTSARQRKSTQVHTRPGQTESQVDPSFQLASTCDSVWPGLNSALSQCSKLLSELRYKASEFFFFLQLTNLITDVFAKKCNQQTCPCPFSFFPNAVTACYILTAYYEIKDTILISSEVIEKNSLQIYPLLFLTWKGCYINFMFARRELFPTGNI